MTMTDDAGHDARALDAMRGYHRFKAACIFLAMAAGVLAAACMGMAAHP